MPSFCDFMYVNFVAREV